MKQELKNFLKEMSNIKNLLSLWNIQKAEGWYNITEREHLDTINIILTPSDHDYICNGHIEEIEKIVDDNSELSWHTYHISVTTIVTPHLYGHMITSIAPQITLNFYMHESDE